MPGALTGKLSVVTGGGSGIGRATVYALARAGATVIVMDCDAGSAERTAEEVRSDGGRAFAQCVDVGKSASVDSAFKWVEQEMGGLDIAVNNAAVSPVQTDLVSLSEQEFDRVMTVNLKGVWLCMRAELPLMLGRGSGSIVNTSSVLGLGGSPMNAPYVAAKHGVIGLTKTAALEFSPRQIRVNAVCPGVIETPMYSRIATSPDIIEKLKSVAPLGRLGAPEEVAEAILWLVSAESSFVTGTTLVVDGGWTA